MDGQDIKALRINLGQDRKDYTRSQFENVFKRKYEDAAKLWTFTWDSSGIFIESVIKGTVTERKLFAENSLVNLVSTAFRSSFYMSSEKEIIFDKNMIQWDKDSSRVASLTIDFAKTDISQPKQIEDFEKLMGQGLYQAFKVMEWRFDWNVHSYEKQLTITALEINNEQPLSTLKDNVMPTVEIPRTKAPQEELIAVEPLLLMANPSASEVVENPIERQESTQTHVETHSTISLPTMPMRSRPQRPTRKSD